jgi:hypothetical protein
MTDTKIELRTNIKFLAKLKKTSTETYQLLREVYGEDTLSRPCVFEWHRTFLGGRQDVEDDERPGRPVTMKTDENVEKVRTLVRNDRRLSIRMIAEELNVDKVTVIQILTENLKMKKSASGSNVTCNETWLFQYDPETKRQSMQWKTTHSPRP